MTISSHNCPSAHDRPDYQTLERLSRSTTQNRIDIAAQLITDNHTDCRAFDNCLEMGDGTEVVCHLMEKAIADPTFKASLARLFSGENLENGFPKAWLKVHQTEFNPLGLKL